MKEGQNEVFSELPQKPASAPAPAESNITPKDAPASNPPEAKVDYASANILHGTLAGTESQKSPFVNVREKKDIKKDLQKAGENLQKAGETAGAKAKNAFKSAFAKIKSFFTSLFTKPRREVTFSVLGATIVGVALLLIPAIFGQKTGQKDPMGIDPETGYTNRETEWNNFTNMIRARVYELSAPDRTTPQQAVLDYFEQLLKGYRGVAQRMDIFSIEAEYYLNMGLSEEALACLLAVDTDYPQPADNDPDLASYFGRVTNYYTLLSKTYEARNDEAMAQQANTKLDEIHSEYNRVFYSGGK